MIYGVATVFPRIINFLLVRVHTDSLNAKEYSSNTDFYIWAAFFGVLLSFGMETTFFRFYSKENDKSSLISTIFLSLVFIVFIFIVLIFCFFDYFLYTFDFENNSLRLKLFIGILALDTLALIPFAYLRVTNRALKYTIIKFMNVGIILLVNLMCLKYIPEFIEHNKTLPKTFLNFYNKIDLVNFIFIANFLGSGISFLLLIPFLKKIKFSFDFRILKKTLYYSWPIVVAGIAYIINENLDKFLIKRLIGDSKMGIYSACFQSSKKEKCKRNLFKSDELLCNYWVFSLFRSCCLYRYL